jgi:hypothetical protein
VERCDFPEKAVILLGEALHNAIAVLILRMWLTSFCCRIPGDEKKGIPVNLLQMLDMAIEIPQFGLIRCVIAGASSSLLFGALMDSCARLRMVAGAQVAERARERCDPHLGVHGTQPEALLIGANIGKVRATCP